MYVVTGASGFLGRFVAQALAARGASVLAVSRKRIAPLPGACMQNVDGYGQATSSPDSVLIHLAETNVIATAETQDEIHKSQMHATLGALLVKDWKHVVYASSAAVYGDGATTARTVDDEVQPSTAYAHAKLACESLVRGAGGSVARLSNLYGPGMSANSVISELLQQIPGQDDIRIRAGSPVRDYLWVEDAADGIAELAIRSQPETFNFGTGLGTSVRHLCNTMLRLAGEDRLISESAPQPAASHLVLDIANTIARLGWMPKVSLDEGLRRLMARR